MTNTDTTPTSAPVIGADTYGDLLNQLDREQVSWTPDVGAKIVGRIVSMVTATSEYGSYPLITLDPGPTEPLVQVHCYHSWLKSDIVRSELHEGDVLGIKYLDRNGNRNAARYRVTVKRTGTGAVYKPDVDISHPTDALDTAMEEPF